MTTQEYQWYGIIILGVIIAILTPLTIITGASENNSKSKNVENATFIFTTFYGILCVFYDKDVGSLFEQNRLGNSIAFPIVLVICIIFSFIYISILRAFTGLVLLINKTSISWVLAFIIGILSAAANTAGILSFFKIDISHFQEPVVKPVPSSPETLNDGNNKVELKS